LFVHGPLCLWINIFQSWRWTQLQPWIKKPFSRTILEC
jgi:hypothetical protein